MGYADWLSWLRNKVYGRMIVLYQFNVARMREPYTAKVWNNWRKLLPLVHLQAMAHPGYVGRYEGEHCPLGYIAPYPDDELVMGNLSAWASRPQLESFTFGPGTHGRLMRHRDKWFEPWTEGEAFNVMWWQPAGKFDLEFAKEQLARLRLVGPNHQLFGFVL